MSSSNISAAKTRFVNALTKASISREVLESIEFSEVVNAIRTHLRDRMNPGMPCTPCTESAAVYVASNGVAFAINNSIDGNEAIIVTLTQGGGAISSPSEGQSFSQADTAHQQK